METGGMQLRSNRWPHVPSLPAPMGRSTPALALMFVASLRLASEDRDGASGLGASKNGGMEPTDGSRIPLPDEPGGFLREVIVKLLYCLRSG